ncbi:MAG: 4Fe-4S dicluster domain-containing protein [bacterium]
MSEVTYPDKDVVVLERKQFPSLLDALTDGGYELLGPTVRNNAVVYDGIRTVDDLPIGWADECEAGKYRLVRNKKKTLFGYTTSSHSWKRFLHPPVNTLFEAKRDGRGFKIVQQEPDQVKRALVGVRSCEIAAIAIHDKIFTRGPYIDRSYQERCSKLFIVAVNCVRAGGTCFCTSMGTGPKASSGFDLSLTEMHASNRHYFLIEVGSKAGKKLVNKLPVKEAKPSEIAAAQKELDRAAASMGRTLKTEHVRKSLPGKFDDPHWEKTAERCLSCGNCTMVCPTCFCTNVQDVTDLTGQEAQRQRRWDSCFTLDYSYIHGGSIRNSVAARYRQWLMHKLVYWPDQFGMLGCVGCGRCITWCPVGIDITEETHQLLGMA